MNAPPSNGHFRFDGNPTPCRFLAGPEDEARHRVRVDPRSDLDAAGAVAYYLLTDIPVLAGRSALEILDQHLNAGRRR